GGRGRAAAVVADRRAGARLGEAHGAGPLAAEHLLGVGAAERLLEEAEEDPGGPGGEAGIHGEGGARAAEELVDRGGDREGEAAAAELGVGGDRDPAALGDHLPGLAVARRGGDVAVAV